jgi:hypothetical protein
MRMVREAKRRQAEAPDAGAASAEHGICQGEELGRALFEPAALQPQSSEAMQGGERERRSGRGNPETS